MSLVLTGVELSVFNNTIAYNPVIDKLTELLRRKNEENDSFTSHKSFKS